MKLASVAVLACAVACRGASAPAPTARAPRTVARAGSATAPTADTEAPEPALGFYVEPFPAEVPFRLPHTFEPSRYRARLALGDKWVTGHIEIEGDLREEASLIWLHAADLAISRAKATNGETEVPLEFSPPRYDQVLGLRSKSPLAPGHWTLSIDYTAPIREQDPAIKDPRGGADEDPAALGVFRRRVGMASYIFTQSEAISARKIFPCLDEPDRKVPWQLTLDVAKDLVAASNTPIVRETPIDATHRRVEFAETRPLPSYLIAFAVGPFDIVDAGKAKSGTPIRILALGGRATAVAAAVKATPRILDLLEAWLDVPYAYGKLDLVDVPHLGYWAMENAGLVTVTQSVLEQAGSSETISHELAHQWFGDLVTCSWWDDIWLNESFAAFMADKIEAQLAGDSGIEEPEIARAEALDAAYRGVHVRRHATTLDDLGARAFAPWNAAQIGSKILAGIEASLGEDRFRAALHAYLTAHADRTVATADLMSAFATAGAPIEATLTNLLDGRVVVLKPHELCTGKPRLQFPDTTEKVPVCVAYDRDGKRAESCAVLGSDVHDVPLPSKSCPRWVLPNVGGAGLYSVEWTKQAVDEVLARGWRFLTSAEKEMLLDELDDDALKLAVFVKLTTEPDHRTTPREVTYLTSLAPMVPADLKATFDAWILARFGKQARDLHFKIPDGTPARAQVQLSELVQLVATTLDPQLADEATRIVTQEGLSSHDRGLSPLILALAASTEPKVAKELFDELWDDTKHGKVPLYDVVAALRQVPNLVELAKAEPTTVAHLHRYLLQQVFGAVCDANARKDLASLVVAADNRGQQILQTIDRCVATRNALDPLFRSWLSPKPAAKPTKP